MESTRPIRALMRGLDALTFLNLRDGATVSEVAQDVRLPRTTVYRILETLCNAGFAARDAVDDRYRVTQQVRGLSEGFDDDIWVSGGAKAVIEELSREIVWPLSVSTLSGLQMMIRETTDHSTPLAVERYSAGFRAPLLTSAMGRAYLAFCAPAQRESLLDQLASSTQEEDKAARGSRPDLQRMLNDIKALGQASVTRARRLLEEVSIAVPVLVAERPAAVLTVRVISSAVPHKIALERYLPKLRLCAAKIGVSISEQHTSSGAKGTSDAAA